MNQVQNTSYGHELEPTPIRTPDHRVICNSSGGCARDTKVSQLDTAIFIGEDICPLDISVDYTLIVKIYKPFQYLRDVYCHEIFGKLSETLADIVQRPILTKPFASISDLHIQTKMQLTRE